MTNDFIEQFSDNIRFSYRCFDRVIIRGYIHSLFYLGSVVFFLRSLGFKKLSQGVLRILTDQLDAHIKKEADKHHIPIIWWPSVTNKKKASQLDYVLRNYANRYKGKGNHAYCILTNRESVTTVSSRELTNKKGKIYQKLYQVTKQVKQYYIYFHDEVLGGPCYLKISSYLPFTCEFYFNGHNAIKIKLDEAAIRYRMKDNSFVEISDIETFHAIIKEITGEVVRNRINYWMKRFFKFNKGKYSTKSKYLVHDWYMSQVEVCSNVIFKSSRFCTSLFERLLEKFKSIGSPDSLSQIFDQRRGRKNGIKNSIRLYDNKACAKSWFRGNSIKLYNKLGYFLRVETTINAPKLLGSLKLKKPVAYLQAYLWFGIGSNNRYLDCCADVDVSSILDDQIERYTKPVLDSKGRAVTAPDLRKDRQTALFSELLKLKYMAHDFRTKELVKGLSEHFRNSAQIRYEMKKLLVRGLIEKRQHTNYYRVTKIGWKWLWLSIFSNRRFVNPMISILSENRKSKKMKQPSEMEKGLQLVNQSLDIVINELRIAA